MIAAIIFILLGALIKYGKLYFLIAGYNTMSKEEKKTYDIEGIATIFRNAMFGMAFILILGHFISVEMNNPKIETYSMYISIAMGLPYLLAVSNSDKFKNKRQK